MPVIRNAPAHTILAACCVARKIFPSSPNPRRTVQHCVSCWEGFS